MAHYVLTHKLSCRLGFLRCYRCGEEIEEGDEVVSTGSRGVHRKYYHQECFESMFIEA